MTASLFSPLRVDVSHGLHATSTSTSSISAKNTQKEALPWVAPQPPSQIRHNSPGQPPGVHVVILGNLAMCRTTGPWETSQHSEKKFLPPISLSLRQR